MSKTRNELEQIEDMEELLTECYELHQELEQHVVKSVQLDNKIRDLEQRNAELESQLTNEQRSAECRVKEIVGLKERNAELEMAMLNAEPTFRKYKDECERNAKLVELLKQSIETLENTGMRFAERRADALRAEIAKAVENR